MIYCDSLINIIHNHTYFTSRYDLSLIISFNYLKSYLYSGDIYSINCKIFLIPLIRG